MSDQDIMRKQLALWTAERDRLNDLIRIAEGWLGPQMSLMDTVKELQAVTREHGIEFDLNDEALKRD